MFQHSNGVAQFALETGNPYLMGAYAPIFEERSADNLKVKGEIPKDIHGAYFRNGPNQRFTPTSHYHWFDGDGMLHGVYIENGKAAYKTVGYAPMVLKKRARRKKLCGKASWEIWLPILEDRIII